MSRIGYSRNVGVAAAVAASIGAAVLLPTNAFAATPSAPAHPQSALLGGTPIAADDAAMDSSAIPPAYEYDDRGYLIHEIHYTDSGAIFVEKWYTYTDIGGVKTMIIHYGPTHPLPAEGPLAGHRELHYTYEENRYGQQTTEAIRAGLTGAGNVLLTTTKEYNEQHFLAHEAQHLGTGALWIEQWHTYDQLGVGVTMSVRYGQAHPIPTDGPLAGHRELTHTYQYNRFNQLIGESIYAGLSTNGELLLHKDYTPEN